MTDYNAEQDRSAKVFAAEFVDTAELHTTYSLNQGKNVIKNITDVLRETYNQANKYNGMANLLLQTPRGTYDGKVPKYMDFIELYETSSDMDFSFTQAYIAAGEAMGTKRASSTFYNASSQRTCGKHTCLDPVVSASKS